MNCNCQCNWEKLDTGMKFNIINKYFDKRLSKDDKCEIFCIEGIPAACMVYNTTNIYDQPIANSFHLNKAFLLLFDAGPHMRSKLYKRYKHIDIRNAENRNEFMLF